MIEAVIRQRVLNWASAVGEKNLERLMSFYAHDIVSFDVDPPLRYGGTERKRLAWEAFFAVHTGPVIYEVSELTVTTNGELAFAHSLNHVKGTLASGRTTDLWVRWTACFRRIDGAWLILHDHASVPADLAHGKAVVDLLPVSGDRRS